MPTKRTHTVATRISGAGWVEIEKLRVEYDTDMSRVVRAALHVALQHPRELRALLDQQV
jgi:hypothetical protein